MRAAHIRLLQLGNPGHSLLWFRRQKFLAEIKLKTLVDRRLFVITRSTAEERNANCLLPFALNKRS